MPELPEVENARTVLAEAVGRTITAVDETKSQPTLTG
ncbi:DNA-formamidopyrimidine glycosylase family protein [Pseudonocardia tropica]|uniref:DNA-formamidopyrimidine glycosylase family protein n=1 Tax=Pseudonocardia tropica TaxID=681289 RepID=A0ABV1JS52_9PSEU